VLDVGQVHLLEQRQQGPVHDEGAVAGVADDVADLVGEQPDVEQPDRSV